MENLLPINEMYGVIQQSKDYSVIKKYQEIKKSTFNKQSPTKKGSYLDDEIRNKSSPGPANKSNNQNDWSKIQVRSHKYGDRRTYVDEIQINQKKRNNPSPNSYNITQPWASKQKNNVPASDKINYLDSIEFQSNKSPGPGNYNIRSQIGKKVKEYKHIQNHSKQPLVDKSPNMTSYDPISMQYQTFDRIKKQPKKQTAKQDAIDKLKKQNKPNPKNKTPGPGQYQIINTWKGKQAMPKGSLSYMGKISKGPTPTLYYH